MKPNILFISLDAVRAQNLPFYGYGRNTTPFLKSIEPELAVYENAISSAYWTMPSVASLFTGMYTSGHGLVADGDRLDSDLLTISDVLKGQGYQSGAFVKNIYVSQYSGMDRGFDTFCTTYPLEEKIKKTVAAFSKKTLNSLTPPGITRKDEEYTANTYGLREKGLNSIARLSDILIDRGGKHFVSSFSDFINENRTKPFFAYVHLLETHSPYRSPFQFAFKHMGIKENLRKLFINHDHLRYLTGECDMSREDFDLLEASYDNSITYADSLIESMFHLLKKSGLYDDTLIVILSDHGDNIGDHGLMFHYFCLYDSLVKIPLLVKYPEKIGVTGRISETVQNVDMAPLVYSLLDIQEEKVWNQMEGNDILGKGPQKREKGLAISELIKVFGPDRMKYKESLTRYDRRLLSVRTSDKKMIYSSRGDHECYDLVNDPGELNNLYPSDRNFGGLKEKAEKYYRRMDAFFQNNRQKIEGLQDKECLDKDVEDQLKSLGYM